MLQGTLRDVKNGCAVVPHKIVIRHTRSRGRFGFVESCHGCLRRQLVTRRRAQSDREGESVLEHCSYNKSDRYIPSSLSYSSPPSSSIEEQQDKSREPGVRVALSILKFYKTGISPLLPPSCRFLPTCSVYAAEAYSTYGVKRGTILTVWRLLRCTPWGDSGYDPVQWPPPKLGFLEKW